MSVLILEIETGRPSSYLEAMQVPGGKHAIAMKVQNFLNSVVTGGELATSGGNPPSVDITVQDSQTQATGTFTLASVIATDAIAINGVQFTGVASGATGDQFNIGADDDETAVNMANAINNSATSLIAEYVSAQASANVVTITSQIFGIAGNMTTIVSGDATITASGARLTGGADDASALTLNF